MDAQRLANEVAAARSAAHAWRWGRPMRRRAAELTALVSARLPMEFEVTGDNDAWPLVGAALLSRATSTLHHVVQAGTSRQSVDAATLGRSLYEHVVHLAWLGADPTSTRIEAWRKADLVERLKADTEARTYSSQILGDAEREGMEAEVSTMTGDRPILTNLAVAADEHWAARLPGMNASPELCSFRGLYALLYRSYSGTAHPSLRGLNAVIEDVTATRKRVVLEKPTDAGGPVGMATVVYGLGLYVGSQTLGWPGADEVTAVFERFPSS